MTVLRDLHLGRLGLPSIQDPITEQLGGDVQSVGDASAVGQRRAKGFTLDLIVHGFDEPSQVAVGNRMRRQLRALVQNDQLRNAGIYMMFSPDPERNGWLVIGQGELADSDGGVTFGSYKLTLSQAFLVAAIRTHREGYRAALTDRRLVTTAVDTLGQIINTSGWFAALTPLALTAIPVGATDVAVADAPVTTIPCATREGGSLIAVGLKDGDVVSWERAEASFNLGDVVVYDRRGNLGPFGSAGAYDPAVFPADLQAAYGWEEIYGPDYPYSWLAASGTLDAPVLDNGVCRVRYDHATGTTPGLIIDLWDTASGTYQPQVKVTFVRTDSGTNSLDTLISASVSAEPNGGYTPDRAVIELVMATSQDPRSRERIYITLQRGWTGPRVEMYAAPGLDGTSGSVSAEIHVYPAGTDSNETVVAVDSAGAAVQSTAATGLFPSGSVSVGGGSFTGENWLHMLREGRTYALQLAVVQAPLSKFAFSGSEAFGANQNAIKVQAPAGGYVSTQLGFSTTASDQTLEAEAIRNTASSTTSTAVDVNASQGQCVQDTQTTEATSTLTRVTNLPAAKYRVLARVRMTSAGTGSFRAKFGGSATDRVGGVVTSTATSFTEIDLGEITASSANLTLQVNGWGSAPVRIDRVELVKVESRMVSAAYDGVRDFAQSCLYSSRVQTRRLERG